MTSNLDSKNQSHGQVPLFVETVAKCFYQGGKTICALDEISLEVPPGQFLAVMGASGSGKSTLLHAVAGLIGVDEGRICVAGQDLSTLGDSALTRFRRQNIGMVFQAFNLIPALSAEKNVRLPALRIANIDQRIEELFQHLGIADRRDHKPGALSGGEQQRVAIARALVTDPALVLADEPTGSLDSETGQGICRLLRELCNSAQRTILVVTHEPQVAMWADRIVVLKDGRCWADFENHQTGDPQWIAENYQRSLTADSAAHNGTTQPTSTVSASVQNVN